MYCVCSLFGKNSFLYVNNFLCLIWGNSVELLWFFYELELILDVFWYCVWVVIKIECKLIFLCWVVICLFLFGRLLSDV